MIPALTYACELDALGPELAACFQALVCDEAATRFVQAALAARPGWSRTLAYRCMRRLVSDYDAYGLLGMYAMHLVSTPQLQQLLPGALPARGRLLDVGAGDGTITACAAPLAAEVYVTETSRVMRRKLRARGYRVLPLDLAREPVPEGFAADLVLCLNVLDRCSHPRSLLSHLRQALAAGGRLLVSVPLPLRPHVQARGVTSDPDEPLPVTDASFERGAARLATELFAPLGFEVERFSRAPYLCRGDAQTPLYVLDAALFVCAASADP